MKGECKIKVFFIKFKLNFLERLDKAGLINIIVVKLGGVSECKSFKIKFWECRLILYIDGYIGVWVFIFFKGIWVGNDRWFLKSVVCERMVEVF